MKQEIGWIAGIAAALLVVAFGFGLRGAEHPGAEASANQAVIATDFPMTGNLAYYGELVSRGLRLAVDNYNQGRKPGEPEVIMRVEDNLGRVQEGVIVFNKVVEQDGAIAVVSLFTPHSVALLPSSARRKVILYATVTSVVEFGVKSPFAFRDYISLPGQGREMAGYLSGIAKASKVGSLVVNDDYGLDSLRLCREEFEKLGGTWGTQEVFEQKDIDIRNAVAKVVASNPDAIYIAGRELSLANAVRQTRELGFKGVIVSNNGFDTPTVFRAVGSAGDDVVFTSSTFDIHNPASSEQADFINRYQVQFQQDPDYNAAHGYTIGQALTRAIRTVGTEPEKLRAFLQNYDTTDMLGKGKMTPTRDVSREVALYRFSGGERKLIVLE